ncbi:hypothetical protein [Legionella tunisiensis]|uniref:hypothetical protein n=1 Tax=Legionella tunisiensis TaxID=1034944 RepID=UPI0002DEE36E|nr:hypothetical protein [Legionella tunisiensis]
MPLSLDENFSPSQLLEKIAKMQTQAIPERIDLQKKVLCAYREKTLYDLSLILKGDIFDSQIELAELATDSLPLSGNGLTASTANGLHTLKTNVFNLQIRALKSFLADNWEMVNGTALCYTAHPDSDLTFILSAIAKLVWDNKAVWMNEGESWCVLKLLMPTLSTDSLDGTGSYPSLHEVNDVLQVLNTHILGREGKYLIPVKKLNELAGTSTTGWVNPYYDYKCHSEEMVSISAEEYQRLIRHSDYTEALFNAHNQYEISLNEQGSLLTHLRQLSRLLYFNSKHGAGNEANAGEGAYDAIIHFNEYFSKLDKVSKGQIPAQVMVQINILLDLASNATQNIEGDICIANRRKKLEEAMHPVEQILMGIGLSSEDKDHLVNTKNNN